MGWDTIIQSRSYKAPLLVSSTLLKEMLTVKLRQWALILIIQLSILII